jgi:hypothetical protein
MPRTTLHFAALFAASLLVLCAEQPPQSTLLQDHAGIVNGINIPSIAGAPFSATVVIEAERDWPEGYTEVFRTISLVARDSLGRTHSETRRLMPENFHGSPQLMNVRLFDPQTRIHTVYDPTQKVATQQIVPKQPKAADPPYPFVHIEDLGVSTLNGLQTKGTRRTLIIPAKASGNRKRVEVEDEEWYSEDLHINLLVRYADPRIGTNTIGVSNLKREEPPASMFQVPAGYKILNLAPSSAPSRVPAPTDPGAQLEPPKTESDPGILNPWSSHFPPTR